MTDPARTLTQTELDHLATYVGERGRASAPWWYYLGIALAGSVAVSAGDIETHWIAIGLAIAAAASIGALSGALIRRSGMVPRLRSMPAALRRVLVTYWAVAGVVVGVTLVWAFTTEGNWVYTRAGAVVAVVNGVGGVIADRIYRRRAHRRAEEAGIARG